MSIEDYEIVKIATVHGRKHTIVWPDEDGDYVFIENDNDPSIIAAMHITSVRDAILLPLPEVTDVPDGRNGPSQSAADDYTYSASVPDSELERYVRRGAATAAVLLHRKEQREAVPSITEDLELVLNRQAPANSAYIKAAKRVRKALKHGAVLVEGPTS